jgi:hypothetical protein
MSLETVATISNIIVSMAVVLSAPSVAIYSDDLLRDTLGRDSVTKGAALYGVAFMQHERIKNRSVDT